MSDKAPAFDPAADGWRPMPRTPLPGGLGVPWSKKDEQGWRYGIQTEASHANPQGALHGGVLMTMADHGLSIIAWEAGGRAPCTTIQLNTQFVAAVRPGEFVWVRGEVTKRTGSMVFMRGIMATPDRDVAAVDGIWRILRSQ